MKYSPIARIGAISKDDFLLKYKVPATPVVIENLTQDWPAREKWSADYFTQVAGNVLVPLYESQRAYGRKHQHAAATTMPFKDYLAGLQAGENHYRTDGLLGQAWNTKKVR